MLDVRLPAVWVLAYLMASARIAQAIHGSRVRSRIRRSSVGVWWKLHL